jgi:hypothetical protein
VVRNHPSVNWYEYFKSIRSECPWSYSAYLNNQIDFRVFDGTTLPLGDYLARVYILDSEEGIEQLTDSLDFGQDQWLFSYPKYGEWAAPVPILIQQDRALLTKLRNNLGEPADDTNNDNQF